MPFEAKVPGSGQIADRAWLPQIQQRPPIKELRTVGVNAETVCQAGPTCPVLDPIRYGDNDRFGLELRPQRPSDRENRGAKTGTVTSSRAYDFNDHLTSGTCSPASLCAGGASLSYAWTASGRLALMTGDTTRSGQSGYGAGKSETLHSVGGQPIFTTNANGVLDDLKIGALGDITTLAGTGGGKAGLTIWDRELGGRQSSWHSSAGIGNWYPPGDPTQGYNLNHPDDRGILFVQMARTDGMTDRHNVFQGSRVYDYTLGQWTSSDSSPGSLDDAFSYRSYLYDRSNSLTYGDPSGNDVTSLPNGDAPDQDNTIGGIVGAILGFFGGLFGGLFGGHGHNSGPQPPPEERPDNPSKYANNPDILAGKGPLEIILPALGGLGMFGGISAEAAGLGGEVASVAGVETAAASSRSLAPNYIYSSRVLLRSAEVGNDAFHNFPGSLDSTILQGTRTVTTDFYNVARPSFTNDAVNYTIPGTINGYDGLYQIGTRPSITGNTELIMHRFFLPK